MSSPGTGIRRCSLGPHPGESSPALQRPAAAGCPRRRISQALSLRLLPASATCGQSRVRFGYCRPKRMCLAYGVMRRASAGSSRGPWCKSPPHRPGLRPSRSDVPRGRPAQFEPRACPSSFAPMQFCLSPQTDPFVLLIVARCRHRVLLRFDALEEGAYRLLRSSVVVGGEASLPELYDVAVEKPLVEGLA